jgi:hypothetical protein
VKGAQDGVPLLAPKSSLLPFIRIPSLIPLIILMPPADKRDERRQKERVKKIGTSKQVRDDVALS